LDSSETPGWRVGVFQVRPGGSGSGGGGTRIRLRARPPYGRFHLAMGPRLPFGLPAPRPRSRFLRAGDSVGALTSSKGTVKLAVCLAGSGRPAIANITFAPVRGTVLKSIARSSDSEAWPGPTATGRSGRANQGCGELGW